MTKLTPFAVVVSAIVLAASAVSADTGFTCSFIGGAPGQENAEGNLDPWQDNGARYESVADTIRDAAKEARLACSATEQLGAQGCMFQGCVDMAAATTEEKPATN